MERVTLTYPKPKKGTFALSGLIQENRGSKFLGQVLDRNKHS